MNVQFSSNKRVKLFIERNCQFGLKEKFFYWYSMPDKGGFSQNWNVNKIIIYVVADFGKNLYLKVKKVATSVGSTDQNRKLVSDGRFRNKKHYVQ